MVIIYNLSSMNYEYKWVVTVVICLCMLNKHTYYGYSLNATFFVHAIIICSWRYKHRIMIVCESAEN